MLYFLQLYFTVLWLEIIESEMTLQTLNITSFLYERNENVKDEVPEAP